MPKKKDNPGTLPPIEEEPKGDVPIINEEGHSNEELPEEGIETIEKSFFKEDELTEEEEKAAKEEEQPSLFEDDRVHRALCSTLDLITSDIKKVEKQIEHKQLEKSVLINRKEEQELAIKDYEGQRAEKE